jgi:hypothetical protein
MVPETGSQFPVPGSQWERFAENWELVFCYAVSQMRWTARFLLLVMLAPVYEPLATACITRPAAMHCMRQSLSGSTSAHVAQPAMPCHHAMAESTPSQPESSQSSEASIQSANDDNCCKNHCCCGAITSEWAQPASGLLSFLSLLIERAQPSQGETPRSTGIPGHDSARAPPR